MKKSNKLALAKRGILIAGRAQNAGGAQVHADKRKPQRALEKQRLKTQVQHETARNRGPFPFVWPLKICRSKREISDTVKNPMISALRIPEGIIFGKAPSHRSEEISTSRL